ncbi:hypothetical protein C900_00757 [Fulvivirga imtechensis AK7]|uniref:histidine kinase n=1 Tax=Fulvivirga imtechensis AK7 TaxID=1237149 RepID=L8JUY0_9BACT|nr:PAS domain S-box protein [Fulvivirga imtechensis]ELR72796.1 hypothetical protein C900_00757 [Fulvivirga imtechensis AK7]
MKLPDNKLAHNLGDENRYLSLIFQNSSDLICLLEVRKKTKLYILAVNPSYNRAARAFDPKLNARKFIGKEIRDIIINDYHLTQQQAGEILSHYKLVIKTRKEHAFTEEIMYKGKMHHYSSIITPILDNDGNCTHLLYSSKDLTEKIDYQNRLESSEKKFRALIENAHEGIVLYDDQGVLIYASPSIKNIAGYKEEDLVGKLGTDFIHPEEFEATREKFKEVLSKPGKSVSHRFRLKHVKGHYLWSEATLTNLLHKPDVQGIISNFKDITKQKIAEDQLKENNQLLQNINQNINEGIYRSIPGQKFKYVNNAFLKMFGFGSMEELNKVRSATLYVDQNQRREVHKTILENKAINNIEVKFKRSDGSEFWGLMSSTLIETVDKEHYFDGAIRDITIQKIAEAKSKHSEQLLASISQNITEGIFRTTIQGGIVFANEALVDIFGYDSEEEMVNIDPNQLYADVGSRQEIINSIIKDGFVRNKEVKLQKKNGQIFWGLYSCSLTKGIEGQDVFDGAVRDITEIKQTEDKLTQLNEELRKQNMALATREEELNLALKELSDRNFELDQLVYKTSHDLRSPLTSILGLVNIAKLDRHPEHQTEYLGRIEKSILRLDEFVRSMLNYAKASRTSVKIQKLALKELIESCVRDLEYLDNFIKVKTTIKIEGKDKALISDPLRLKIIFSNIISNAYKYINPNVELSYLKIDAKLTASKLTTTFEDNGIGIHKSQLDKIFDMFYRATEISEGSGLGMYIVKQSVNQLGGKISVSSKIGKGTTFKIIIPSIK